MKAMKSRTHAGAARTTTPTRTAPAAGPAVGKRTLISSSPVAVRGGKGPASAKGAKPARGARGGKGGKAAKAMRSAQARMSRGSAAPAGPAAFATPATHDDPRFTGLLAAFAADPALAAVADEYIATQAVGAPRRFGSRALKVDGKIFAMLSHGRLVVKLPADEVEALVAAGQGVHFDPGHGRLMKEWLSVTSAGASWIALARQAHDHVRGA